MLLHSWRYKWELPRSMPISEIRYEFGCSGAKTWLTYMTSKCHFYKIFENFENLRNQLGSVRNGRKMSIELKKWCRMAYRMPKKDVWGLTTVILCLLSPLLSFVVVFLAWFLSFFFAWQSGVFALECHPPGCADFFTLRSGVSRIAVSLFSFVLLGSFCCHWIVCFLCFTFVCLASGGLGSSRVRVTPQVAFFSLSFFCILFTFVRPGDRRDVKPGVTSFFFKYVETLAIFFPVFGVIWCECFSF